MNFVIWTARLAIFCYLVGLSGRLKRPVPRFTQILWTFGFLVFLMHVWASFEYIHHWSHKAARNATAAQTKELFGWYWGGGIWFNYLFLIAWGVDVALIWGTMNARRTVITLQVFLGFIVVNSTAVFGPSWWIPVIVSSALLFTYLQFQQRDR